MTLEFCKICGESDLSPLWLDANDAEGDMWSRCVSCGCDSADRTYPDVKRLYDHTYIDRQTDLGGGSFEACVAAMMSNIDWYDHFRNRVPDNSFLDVGCCNGAALKAMQDRGWSVHGFDVITPPYHGDHVTVAPHFTASLFPQRYSAVLCREVLEHVDCWLGMLQELHAVTATGGLIQVQTPRPGRTPHPIPYQRYHLQLLTPFVLRSWLEKLGVEILDSRIWDLGAAFMGRRFN